MLKMKSIKINAILSGIKQLCTILFPLITIPYVSRVLESANYGKVNFGSSIVGYFGLLAAFGVSTYAIREGAKIRNDKTKLSAFANEMFTINMITTIISYLLLFALLFCVKQLESYRVLILIQATVIIFTTLGTDWANVIFEDYLYTTCRYILIQILSLVPLFVFVKSPEDYVIYAIIVVIANISGNIVNMFYIRKKYIHITVTKKLNIRTHFKQMLYLFGNTLASTIYVYADITLLTLFKGDEVTGIYSIAVKIYTIVKQVVNAVISVVIPRVSLYIGEKNIDEYNRLLSKVLHTVVVFALPLMTGLYMLSEHVITIIGGVGYISGYSALRILTIALFFAILSYFYVYLVMIPLGLEKYCLYATIISACVNVLLNFVLIPQWGFNGAAITTVFSEIIVLVICRRLSKKYYAFSVSFREFIPSVLGSVIILLICVNVKDVFTNDLDIIIVSILLSCIGYVLILFFLKDKLAMDIWNLMKKMFRKETR